MGDRCLGTQARFRHPIGARTAWRIVQASRLLVHVDRFVRANESCEHLELVYADEIRELMLEPARQDRIQDYARGGKGSR
jgi:hypothetical protein